MSGSAAVMRVLVSSSDDPSNHLFWLFVIASFSDVFCGGSGSNVKIFVGLRRCCCVMLLVTLLLLRDTETPLTLLLYIQVSFPFNSSFFNLHWIQKWRCVNMWSPGEIRTTKVWDIILKKIIMQHSWSYMFTVYPNCLWIPDGLFQIFIQLFCRAKWSVHLICWVKSREIYLELVMISSVENHLLKPVAPQNLLWKVGSSVMIIMK